MKKKLIIFMLVGLLGTTFYQVEACAAGSGVILSGGWSESGGYFIRTDNNELIVSDTYANLKPKMILATKRKKDSSRPDKHTGRRIRKQIDSAGTYEDAAYGETVWYDTYHYTTARMEKTDGTVLTTSGRHWGIGATNATSPYYMPKMFENTEARTYWGRGK